MKIDIDQITGILYRHFRGEPLGPGEAALLERWLKQSAANRDVFEQIRDEREIEQYLSVVMDDRHTEGAFQRFKANQEELAGSGQGLTGTSSRRIPYLRKWGWAAAAVMLLAAGVYLWNRNKAPEPSFANGNKSAQPDVAPGGAIAILTLADGRTIALDSAANGKLAQQGNAQVVKLASGQIAYNPGSAAAKEIMWNTMSTPKGGQYQLVLPDGTKAWLNAASSITFPATFAGSRRQVKIRGEIYFEVAKNEQQPFIVDIDGKSLVEVLGTSFNINSYTDEESIRATLLEGSIRIVRDHQSAVLKPGQQAVIMPAAPSGAGHGIIIDSSVDPGQVLAWKNGIFDFTGADLKTVMRQLERWYDIEVEYQGARPDITFEGRMYRNVNLSDVLEVLQKMGVRTALQGKKLIVF